MLKALSLCGPGVATISAVSDTGMVAWFENDTDTTPIFVGNSFTIPNLTQDTTFYVAATDASMCYSNDKSTVFVEVKQVPAIEPVLAVANCDEDGTPDGFIDFNLNSYQDLIISNPTDFTFTFHHTEQEAQNNTNPVNANNYNNNLGNQLYYRVEGTGVFCYAVGVINLSVSATSLPPNFTYELAVCDEDSPDGIYEFFLEDASNAFLNQLPNGQDLTIAYYESVDDAVLQNNPIDPLLPYRNLNPQTSSLVVRIDEESGNACFGIGENLVLTVNRKPSFELDEFFTFCQGQTVPISPNLTAANYDYQWFDAAGQLLSNSAIFTVSAEGNYSVVATDVATGCQSEVSSFFVQESTPPLLSADIITVEEIGTTGTISIDADSPLLGSGLYEFSFDNPFGPYSFETTFENVAPGRIQFMLEMFMAAAKLAMTLVLLVCHSLLRLILITQTTV